MVKEIENLVNKTFGSLIYEKIEHPNSFVNFENSVFYSLERKKDE